MKKETYIKMTAPFRNGSPAGRVINITNKIITGISFVVYPLLLIYLFATKNELLFRSIVVPLDSFIILSVFRYFINRKRPYEYFELAPAIAKDTKGKSFPSRHVFSAFVIAMTFLFVAPVWMGIVLIVFAVFLGVVRVLTGVHFISDVIAGAICGIVAGLIGFLV